MQMTLPNFSWDHRRFLLWTRAIWSLQNPGRARIKRAGLFGLLISFQCLSQPQSIIQLHVLQRGTFIWAVCLSWCLQRGVFSVYTSRLIAFLAEFPPRNAHLSTGSAAANAAAYPVTPRCPRGWPPRWASTLLPHSLRWKVAETGNAACSRRAETPASGRRWTSVRRA